jgi:hypothetical protein
LDEKEAAAQNATAPHPRFEAGIQDSRTLSIGSLPLTVAHCTSALLPSLDPISSTASSDGGGFAHDCLSIQDDFDPNNPHCDFTFQVLLTIFLLRSRRQCLAPDGPGLPATTTAESHPSHSHPRNHPQEQQSKRTAHSSSCPRLLSITKPDLKQLSERLFMKLLTENHQIPFHVSLPAFILYRPRILGLFLQVQLGILIISTLQDFQTSGRRINTYMNKHKTAATTTYDEMDR